MSENALSIVEALTPAVVFQAQNGVEDVVSRLEKDVRAMSLDPTTEKGRKHIKSVAYQVARSKTALDDMGKQVKADAMELVKPVDCPANVAPLEAEIASLKEAEQLARADAEASKARVTVLEGICRHVVWTEEEHGLGSRGHDSAVQVARAALTREGGV